MSAEYSRIAAAWAALRGKESRATLQDTDGWFVQSLIGAQNASGQSVTPRSSLALTAYFACIRNISDDLAKTPIRMVKDVKGGTFQAVQEHPALTLVSQRPNPMMTAMDFWGTIIAHMLGWQGGFAEIVRNELGQPVEMWPLDPTSVKVIWDMVNKTLIYEVNVGKSGKVVRLRPKDMFHIHGLGFDGFTSFIMADIAQLSIGRALATQEHSAAFFGNGATLKGLLEAPSSMTEKGLKLLNDTFTMRLVGAARAYRTPILPDGVQYREITTNPKDSQLIDAMHLGNEDMARLFRMPLAKIQHDLRSTFNNVAEQNKFYQHDTLSGHARRITEECKSKLLGPPDKDKRFKYDFAELLEADPVAQADVVMKQFQMGLWSPNELREKGGRTGIGKEGDRRFVMGNLVALDKIDEEPPAEPQPPAAEPEPEPESTPEELIAPPEPEFMDTPEIKAILRLFRHDFRRFGSLEEDKAMRAMSDRKLAGWVKSFYPKHERFIAKTLATRFAVLLAVMQERGDGEELAGRMAKEYIHESRDRIEAGARNEDIDNLDLFSGIMAVRAVNMARKAQEAV